MASVHPLPVSWYLISSLWLSLCSCMHIMSMLWSIANADSSGNCPTLIKVQTLNVTICIVRLHFSYFSFGLSSVASFSDTEARAPTSAGCTLFLLARRVKRFGQVVWVWVMVIFRWLFFFLIYRSYPYRWASVVPQSNYLILAVEQ